MCFEGLFAEPFSWPFQSLTEQGLELAALDPVFGFAWHHITCLYVR